MEESFQTEVSTILQCVRSINLRSQRNKQIGIVTEIQVGQGILNVIETGLEMP